MQIKVIIINMVMAVVLIFMILKIVETARQDYHLPDATVKKTSQREDYQSVVLTSGLAPMAAFDTIAGKNLFSPDRTEYVPEPDTSPSTEVVMEKNIGGKKIHLYGIVIRGEKKSALITNPELGKDVAKYAWVEEGMQVGSMWVSNIDKEYIIIQDKTKNYMILLSENDNVQETNPALSNKEESVNIIVTESSQPTTQQTSEPTSQPTTQPAAASEAAGEEGTAAAADADVEAIDTPFGVMHLRK